VDAENFGGLTGKLFGAPLSLTFPAAAPPGIAVPVSTAIIWPDEMKRFNTFSKFFLIFSLIIVNGCSLCPFKWCSPGYYIRIDIHGLQENDRDAIEKVLEELQYSHISRTNSNAVYSSQYQKIVVEDKSFYHPEVDVAVQFELANNSSKTTVLIVNRFSGMKPEVKSEMDKFADILFKKLLAFSDKDKINVLRKSYGPGI